MIRHLRSLMSYRPDTLPQLRCNRPDFNALRIARPADRLGNRGVFRSYLPPKARNRERSPLTHAGYRPDTLPQFVKTEAIEPVVFCSKLCAGGEVAEYRGLSGAVCSPRSPAISA